MEWLNLTLVLQALIMLPNHASGQSSSHDETNPTLEVRLADGSNYAEGRVEVYHGGQWGTVCDDLWDLNDATVVCRMLGFSGALDAPGSARFGQGSDPILLDNVQCSGSEDALVDCPANPIGDHNCGHGEDAGAICIRSATDPTLGVRLVGGNKSAEGRVEVYYDGQWGTVCDDLWDLNDATVVCRMLGFSGALDAPGSARFGQGSDPILLDNVRCSGSEDALVDCSANPIGDHNCGHGEDAGAICIRTATDPTLGVRLVGGNNDAEGRVEVYYGGQWGTVCDDSWGLNDATVVCRMLGFTGALDAPGAARFGEGSGPILLDEVECNGYECTLSNCIHWPIGQHNCRHSEDASVICIRDTEVQPDDRATEDTYSYPISESGTTTPDAPTSNAHSLTSSRAMTHQGTPSKNVADAVNVAYWLIISVLVLFSIIITLVLVKYRRSHQALLLLTSQPARMAAKDVTYTGLQAGKGSTTEGAYSDLNQGCVQGGCTEGDTKHLSDSVLYESLNDGVVVTMTQGAAVLPATMATDQIYANQDIVDQMGRNKFSPGSCSKIV